MRWQALAASLQGITRLFRAVLLLGWPSSSLNCFPYEYYERLCCDTLFGENGFEDCWDATFTFARCCTDVVRSNVRKEALAWQRFYASLPEDPPFEVDYVVVGSGSAGSAVASTLARSPGGPTVLLLEAGTWDLPEDYVGTRVTNAYFEKRQAWWRALMKHPWGPEKLIPQLAGQELGGSSAVNYGYFRKGGGVEELAAALGWPRQELSSAYTRLLADLKSGARSKRRIAPIMAGLQDTDNLSFPDWRQDKSDMPRFIHMMASALGDAGLKLHEAGSEDSMSSGVRSGTWLSVECQWSHARAAHKNFASDVFNCRRQSSYSGLIAPINRTLKKSLIVLPNSFAYRLHLRPGGDARFKAASLEILRLNAHNNEKPRPQGGPSQFKIDGGFPPDWDSFWIRSRQRVSVKKAIILSAGVYSSPAILIRSGIGSPKQLKHLRHKPLINATSLGQGLRDRIAVSLTLTVTDDCQQESAQSEINNGVVQSPVLMAFYNFSENLSNDDPTGPVEVELLVVEGQCFENERLMSIRAILQRSEGYGDLFVRSPHPFASPEARFAAKEGDAKKLVELLRWLQRNVIENEYIRPRIKNLINPNVSTWETDDALRYYVMGKSAWYKHAMGSLSQDVVDDSLRVKDISNVFVADASVLKDSMPSGHPDVPLRVLGYALAQRLLK